jgi:hypothetical protein
MWAVRAEQHQGFRRITVNFVVNIFFSHPICMVIEKMIVMHLTG